MLLGKWFVDADHSNLTLNALIGASKPYKLFENPTNPYQSQLKSYKCFIGASKPY